MMGRIVLAVISAVTAFPHAAEAPVRAADSVFAEVLPSAHAMIPALDVAYLDLEDALRPHGCVGCHAPELATGDRAIVRRAVQVLDTRRSIEAMLEANQMPPETEAHPAGIADPAERARVLQKARVFRALGDAVLASW